MSTTILKKEIEHFAKDSVHWWDEDGPFAVLHRLNPVRMRYIRDRIEDHFDLKADTRTPFATLKIADIGCGGGLVCEPLARLGAQVTGIDADQNAIAVAKEHAAAHDLKIEYIEGSVESISQDSTFDVVTALEIVEHVSDIDVFIQSCAKLCKPGGLLIFSTLNRTIKSYLLGIVAAEHVLNWVPQGTHDWKQFIRPSEMNRMLRHAECKTKDIRGLCFNPLNGEFHLSNDDIDVNYLITAENQK